MRTALRVVLGLVAAVIAGFAALEPPDIMKKSPWVAVALLVPLAVMLFLVERPSRLMVNLPLFRRKRLVSAMPPVGAMQGRQVEVEAVAEFLKGDSKLLYILGPPGIGKTTLAVSTVNSVSRRYSLVIWQSLAAAPPLTDVITSWCRALGSEPSPETSFVGRLSSVSTAIAKFARRRHGALIVLDNTESIIAHATAEQLTELVQLLQALAAVGRKGCKIIVTSTVVPENLPARDLGGFPVEIRPTPLSIDDLHEVVRVRLGGGGSVHTELEKAGGNPLVALQLARAEQADSPASASRIVDTLTTAASAQLAGLNRGELAVLTLLSSVGLPMTIAEIERGISKAPARADIRTVTETTRRLVSRFLVETHSAGLEFGGQHPLRYIAAGVVGSAIRHGLIDELVASIESGGIGGDSLLRTCPLTFAGWPQRYNDLVRERLFAPAAARLSDLGSSVAEQTSADWLALLSSVADESDPGDLAVSNILGFALNSGADLTNVAVPSCTLLGVDLSRSHLFNVDLSPARLVECRFADRIGPVYATHLSDDGGRVVLGLASGAVEVRDSRNLHPVARAEGHSEPVRAVIELPERQLIVSGGEDGRINVYRRDNLQLISSIRAHDSWIWSLILLPPYGMILSVASDGTVALTRLTDVYLSASIHSLLPSRRLWDACTLNDTVYIASEDGTLWATSLGELANRKDSSDAGWRSVADVGDPIKTCCAAGDSIVFGCRDGRLFVLSPSRAVQLQLVSVEDGPIRRVRADPDGNVFTVGDRGYVRKYEAGAMRLVAERKISETRLWALDIARRTFVTGGDERSIRVCDVADLSTLKFLQGYGQTMRSIDWYGDELVIACGDDFLRLARVDGERVNVRPAWTATRQRRILNVVGIAGGGWCCGLEDGSLVFGNDGGVIDKVSVSESAIESLARSRSGELVAAGSEDRRIILKSANGAEIGQLPELHSSRIWALDFSADETKLLSAGGDFALAVWDLRTMSLLWSVAAHENLILAARWLEDGRIVTAGTDGSMKMWQEGSCVAVQRIGSVVRALTVDTRGRVIGVGRNADHQPGWACLRWDVQAGLLTQKVLGVRGGSARSVVARDRDLLIGGDQPLVAMVDSETLSIVSESRVPGPYEGLKIRGAHMAGTDDSSLRLLGARYVD